MCYYPPCKSICIYSICVLIESNAKIVTEEKGLPDVVSAMAAHPTNADLMETASAAILSLSMEGLYL